MRLWLKDTERRPDPLPARTDARTAYRAGTALWLVALVVTVLVNEQLTAAGLGWWLWCSVTGLGLGLVGLLWVQVRRR